MLGSATCHGNDSIKNDLAKPAFRPSARRIVDLAPAWHINAFASVPVVVVEDLGGPFRKGHRPDVTRFVLNRDFYDRLERKATQSKEQVREWWA